MSSTVTSSSNRVSNITPDPDRSSSSQDIPSRHAKSDHPDFTVLLVEDNLVNAQVLSRQLQRSNVTVYVANHGVEALDFLRRTSAWSSSLESSAPSREDQQQQQETIAAASNVQTEERQEITLDFILMDVEMPIMDGLTCTRRIREFEQTGKLQGHMSIIAITANARQEQIDTALRAGMDDVVSKPFRVKDLLKHMGELKSRGRMAKGQDIGNGNGSGHEHEHEH